MARLDSIKEIQNSHLLRLGFSGVEENAAYTIRSALYSQLGRPIRGSELSDEDMALIRREDEYVRAKKRALWLLSYADNNERNLKLKLRARGFSSEVAAEVSGEMVSLGYINESAQLERLILAEANVRLYGPGKIIPRLAAKGYSVSDIKRTLARLVEIGEIDFKANSDALIEKKLSRDAGEEERRALLMKNGYRP